MKAAGEAATSPEVEGEGKGAESYVPGIEGVEIQWEDGGDGEVEAQEDIEGNKNHFVAHPKYKSYPPHNSGFGRKTASFTFAGATIENDFEVFFPKFGNNHPVCPTCEGCPNWFYYWKDGDVCSIPDFVVYTNKAYYGAYSRRNRDTFDIAGRFGELYAEYGDDELRARIVERNISRANYHPELDWCNPGCQTATPYGPEE